jgi:hypothetical protein
MNLRAAEFYADFNKIGRRLAEGKVEYPALIFGDRPVR